jgi:hypothetical protein
MHNIFNKTNIFAFFILVLLSSINISAFSQNKNNDFVQFSGVVVSNDSLQPIPFVNIYVEDEKRGTISDFNGFFSFVARKGDLIMFESVGFRPSRYKIPDTLSKDRYTLIQILSPDTIILDETFIFPWPTYEQFKQAFLSVNIPDDDLARARKNIEQMEKRMATESWAMDGSMNYRNFIQNKVADLYYSGQYRPINLLNPFAWAQFIKAWKEGKFKNKSKQ